MDALKVDLKAFRKDISFSSLTESALTEFVVYLRDTKKLRTPRKKKGDRKNYDNEDITGLRNSDANNLRRSDIKGDHIEVTTVKTADSISIELNDITKAILEKYKEVPFKDNKALPNLTNQAMNRGVKELCKLAGLDEEIRITTYKGSTRTDEVFPKWAKVGTHTGRRTFIVQALSMGISPNIVIKWTGHSDYKAIKPYIDIVDSIKAESMTKFNN